MLCKLVDQSHTTNLLSLLDTVDFVDAYPVCPDNDGLDLSLMCRRAEADDFVTISNYLLSPVRISLDIRKCSAVIDEVLVGVVAFS